MKHLSTYCCVMSKERSLELMVATATALVRRRVAKATGATVVTTLADMEGNETFDASNLGSAEEVCLRSTSGQTLVLLCSFRADFSVIVP